MRKLLLLFTFFLCAFATQISAQCTDGSATGNRCLDFDPNANTGGGPDFVQAAVFPLLSDPNFTIECRFRMPSTNTGTNARRLLSLSGSGNLFHLLEIGGRIHVSRQPVSGTTLTSTVGLTTDLYRDNQWHHIAATRNGVNLAVYIDGVLKWSNGGFTGNLALTTFRVGAPSGTLTNVTWQGRIDEVRVWDVARSLEQINATRSCPLQGNEANLKLYYKLDQHIAAGNNIGATTATDLAGGDNNGTLNAFLLTGSASNWVCGDDAFCACAANFTFTVDNCGKVTFTNTSNLTPPPPYSWNFGDPNSSNNTSTQTSPMHTYATAGTYSVCLTAGTGPSTCSTCKTVQVTSVDNQGPMLKCLDISLQFNNGTSGPQTIFPQMFLDGALTDNCCPANSITLNLQGQLVYTCDDVCKPPKLVFLIATDCNGNTSTCSAFVSSFDNDPPVARCKKADVFLGSNGNVTMQPSEVNNGSTDNCGIESSSVNIGNFSCPPPTVPCPFTQTVVLTVTDYCGKSATCTATVTVKDELPPVIQNCPQNISVSPIPGQTSATATWTAPTATDNCPGTILTSSHASGSSFPIGSTVVSYTATDRCGNKATCSFTVTVSGSQNCVCGFENMTFDILSSAPRPVICGQSNFDLVCPAGKTFNIAGTFNCGPVPGCSTSNLTWTVTNSSNVAVASGTFTAGNFTIPISGSTVATPGNYTVTIKGFCGQNMCTCTFNILSLACPPSCECGFTNMLFNSGPTPQQIICGQSAFNLGCPDGKTYNVAGTFNCGPVGTNCTASGLTWNIVNASNVSVASGTFTSGAFNIPINGSVMNTAGTYTMTISGTCGTNKCICVIRFVSTGCGGACECGTFTNLMITRKTAAGTTPVKVNLACGQTANMPCPVKDYNWHLTGSFACVGDCAPTNMTWNITNSAGTVVSSGTMAASPFNVFFSGSAISTPGTYTLTLEAVCGTQKCRCVLNLVVECPPEPPLDELCGKAVVTCYGFDPTEPAAAIIDVRNNSAAPLGDDWLNPTVGPATTKTMFPNWSIDRMGNVFGIAIDPSNNVYIAASDIYHNDAFKPSVVGDAGTGGIYKASGLNLNNVTDLVTTQNSNAPPVIGTNNLPNTGGFGNGIGNVAFDKIHNQLFATNLEDGRIYRINPTTGIIIDAYDPFTLDNGVNGMTTIPERLWGIGLLSEGTAFRLYFGTQKNGAVGSRVYSLLLTPSGGFPGAQTANIYTGGGEVIEFECGVLTGLNCSIYQGLKITDIEFSELGKMLITERGDPHSAKTYELIKIAGAWSVVKQLYIGPNAGSNSAGGCDYGYVEKNGDITHECDALIWNTGNFMPVQNRPGVLYGLEGINALTGNNLDPANRVSDIYVDFDGDYITDDKSEIGDVDIFKCRSCLETPPCDSLSASLMPVIINSKKDCCYKITLNNKVPTTFESVNITVDGANLQIGDVTPAAGWAYGGFVAGTSVELQPAGGGYVPVGSFTIGTICLKDITKPDQTITLNFLDAQGISLCDTTFKVKCDYCAYVIRDTIKCGSGSQRTLTFCLDAANNLGYSIESVVFMPPPGVTFTPSSFSVSPPLTPTDPCRTFTVAVDLGSTNPTGTLCYGITVHEGDVAAGDPPLRCCMIKACTELPDCLCDSTRTFATFSPAKPLADGLCCYDITLNQPPGEFVNVQTELLTPGSIFSAVGTGAGWNSTFLSVPKDIWWTPNPVTTLPAVTTLPTVCFAGTAPQILEISWMTDDSVYCYDQLQFNCTDGDCAIFDSLSMICNVIGGSAVTFSFNITNNSGQTITHAALVNVTPAGMMPAAVFPLGSLADGATSPTLTTTLNNTFGTQLCFQVNLYYQNPDNKLDIKDCCLTDEMCFTVPRCTLQNFNRPIVFFPNPTRDEITLMFEGGAPANGYLRVRDVSGRLMFEEAVLTGAISHRAYMEKYPSGLYFVEFVENQRRIWSDKVVRQ